MAEQINKKMGTFSIAIFLLVSSPNSASSRILRIFFFCLLLELIQKHSILQLDTRKKPIKIYNR